MAGSLACAGYTSVPWEAIQTEEKEPTVIELPTVSQAVIALHVVAEMSRRVLSGGAADLYLNPNDPDWDADTVAGAAAVTEEVAQLLLALVEPEAAGTPLHEALGLQEQA